MSDSIREIALKKFFLGPTKAVCDSKVLGFCVLPYPGHKKGCPNFDRKSYCPPKTRFFPTVYERDIYIVAVGLNFKAYRETRKRQHPSWTERQLRNPLYWQGYLRKRLKDYTDEAFAKISNGRNEVVSNPEAMGVDLTETCRQVGLQLEWPPDRFVYKMYLIGSKRENA